MAKRFDGIDSKLEAWISAQPMYFVGSAPTDPSGHVNVSPKGDPCTFRVLGPNRVAYVDVVGSGAETIAHLRDNGRVVIMFCAFSGPPRIVRLHGRGSAAQIGTERFDELLAEFDAAQLAKAGLTDTLRSVIEVDVTRVADSCGYGVPIMALEATRTHYQDWSSNRFRSNGPNALVEYSCEHNAESIDGLPGVEPEVFPLRS